MGLFSKIKSKAKSTVNKVKASVTKNVAKLATAVQKKAPKASSAVKSTVSKLSTVSKPKTTSSSSNSSKSSSSKSSSSKSSGTSSSLLQKSLSAIVPNVSADTSTLSPGTTKSAGNYSQKQLNSQWYNPETGVYYKPLTGGLQQVLADWISGEGGFGRGTWLGLPEYGGTEMVGGKTGSVLGAAKSTNDALGSSNTGIQTTDEYKSAIEKITQDAATEGLTPDQYLDKKYKEYLTSSGAEELGGGTGGGITGTVLDQGTYSVTDAKTGEEVFGSLKEGASEEQVAQINALIAEYDRQQALNQNQLAYLGNQRQTALDTYGNQNKELMSQIATAKTNAERDVETGKQSLYETAQGTQRSNRNVLRALGILGSSAAGEMLTKPNTEAAKQVGNLQTQLVQRKKELDDLAIQKQNEYAVNVKELEDNYAKLVSDIQIDSRYNEDEKLAAIQNVNAAYSTRAAELDQAMLQWNQDIQTQAQQYALDIARMQAYQGITPDYTSLYNSKVSV